MPTASPSTATIYVRVPQRIKDAAGDYAEARALTLTGAISELLDRGLESAEAEGAVALLRERLRECDGELRDARRRLESVRALTERGDQALGTCPACQTVVTALDVFSRGCCAQGHPLSSLLQTPQQAGGGLDQTQFLILIGALGLFLGAAALVKS